MKRQRETQHTLGPWTPPRQVSQSFLSWSDHCESNSGAGKSADDEVVGAFLEAPPLAMLNASEHQATVRGPNNELVWAPLVCFSSFRNDKQGGETCGGDEMAHAVFYEWNDYSFLIFLDPQAVALSEELGVTSGSFCEGESGERIDALLKGISNALSECLSLHAGDVLSETYKETIHDCLTAPGQDVLFVDRASSEVRLYPHAATFSPHRKHASPKGLLNSLRPTKSIARAKNDGGDAMDWASDGMDCRHWLASRLPEQTLLAFDDVMNAVHYWRQGQKEKRGASSFQLPSSGVDGSYELMTTISQSWIYAVADEEHEVYVLLDSSIYVTLADAQKAIQQVRAALSFT